MKKIENSSKVLLFGIKHLQFQSHFDSVSEHVHPLNWKGLKKHLVSEHCHPNSRGNPLYFFLFRSICTHMMRAIVFRSITTQFSSLSFYFCVLIFIGNKLAHNYMAGKTTEMSKLKQVLQLHESGASNRSIAAQLGLYKETVNKYIRHFKTLSIDIKVLLQKDDPELEYIFNGGSPAYSDKRFDDFSKRLPYLEKELGHKHVTRLQLWEEYISEYPGGYGFTQFCFHLNQHTIAQMPSTVLVNTYVAGEKCYVDFAGDTMEYADMDTGEIIKVQTFVGCLPYTDYAFAVCVPSQKSEDFIYAITRMFAFFGGVTKIVVPDNLKSAVIKSDRYEPEINRLMEHLGNHYGFVTLPARPGKPKDKCYVKTIVT